MRLSCRSFLWMFLTAVAALPALASNLDVVFYDDRFGTLNDATGVYTPIGTLPLSASSGIASMNGLMYLENMGADLFSVNPATGAYQLIGATDIGTTSGAFAGGTEGLFEVDYSSNLYSINPLTGKGTLVGATGLTANNGSFDTSLSSDGTSLLYTAGRAGAGDELYRIDIATGVATDLGSTGVTGIAGSAFVDGELELFQYGQGTNYVYTAPDGSNVFTRGSVLSAQIIDGGVVNPIAEVSTYQGNTTPEPASFVLFAGGLTTLLRRRKRGAELTR